MNEIKERYSVREFTNKQISKKDLIEILNCGILAPSVKNTQPWFLTILEENAKEKFISFLEEKTAIPSISSIKSASALILVWNRNENGWRGEEHSCCALIQNILLKATNLNIGSLWIGEFITFEKEIQTYFQKDFKLVAGIALGYPKEQPKYRGRKSIEKVCEFLK